MDKNYREILHEVYSGTAKGERMKRREAIINEYLQKFGNLILQKELKPIPVMNYIAKTYNVSRIGVLKILKDEGIYQGSKNPVVFPSELSKV